MAEDSEDSNAPIYSVTDVHPNFIKFNGNSAADVKLDDALTATVHGDLSADGKTLTVKTINARHPDGSDYAAVHVPDAPFPVAVKDGRLDADGSELKGHLAHLEERVKDSLGPKLRPVTMDSDQKSFAYELPTFAGLDRTLTGYTVYHGIPAENGNATITHVEFLDKDRHSDGKIELDRPLAVDRQNNTISVSGQQLHDLASQAHGQQKAAEEKAKKEEEEKKAAEEQEQQGNFIQNILMAMGPIGLFILALFSGGLFGGGQQQGSGQQRGGRQNPNDPQPGPDMATKMELYAKEVSPDVVKKFDTNKDGALTTEEKLDTNHDRHVSLKEISSFVGFNVDKDRDGRLSGKEAEAVKKAVNEDEKLKALVANNPEVRAIRDNFLRIVDETIKEPVDSKAMERDVKAARESADTARANAAGPER